MTQTLSQTVAVLGASQNRSKFGNKSVRAHAHAGWTVFPVHPSAEQIEDLASYPSLGALPETPDRITVYLPPRVTVEMLPQIAQTGAKEVWINPGAGSPEVFEEARRLGLTLIDGCSIVDLGLSPSQFPG